MNTPKRSLKERSTVMFKSILMYCKITMTINKTILRSLYLKVQLKKLQELKVNRQRIKLKRKRRHKASRWARRQCLFSCLPLVFTNFSKESHLAWWTNMLSLSSSLLELLSTKLARPFRWEQALPRQVLVSFKSSSLSVSSRYQRLLGSLLGFLWPTFPCLLHQFSSSCLQAHSSTWLALKSSLTNLKTRHGAELSCY